MISRLDSPLRQMRRYFGSGNSAGSSLTTRPAPDMGQDAAGVDAAVGGTDGPDYLGFSVHNPLA